MEKGRNANVGGLLGKKAFQLCPDRRSPSNCALGTAEQVQVTGGWCRPCAAGAALATSVKNSAVNLDQRAIRNI